MESYIDQVMDVLITHSCEVGKDEVVIIECIDLPGSVISSIIEKVFSTGAIPVILEKSNSALKTFAMAASEQAYKNVAENELFIMRRAKHFIGLRKPDEANTFSDVPIGQMRKLLDFYIKPVHYEYRNKFLHWVYLRLPTGQMAEKVGMDQAEFEKYYYQAMLVDYGKLGQAMEPLEALLRSTKEVRIIGPGRTDLSFELGNFGVYRSIGHHNLPDGEIFTAPVRGSVNGRIEFNIDSFYYGTQFSNINLQFKHGKVIHCEADNATRLNDLLNIDDGARYIGEFALGVNPVINKPINDILFDEKINTSLHLALGNAYPVADNGNRSSIHWDLILDQSAARGGGTIFFDGKAIRENGVFTQPELASLNS